MVIVREFVLSLLGDADVGGWRRLLLLLLLLWT
jgi:hypothetical protein